MDEDRVALVDMDGTVADYDRAMNDALDLMQGPDEVYDRLQPPPYIEARMNLVKRIPGFWRGLARIERGFEVVEELRARKFELHVLTKGPTSKPLAWGEKVEWCREQLPDALVTVTENKALVYGRVLVDDWPPYFLAWLKNRPRGLVITVAQPWNERIVHPNVFRYDGTNRAALQEVLLRAFDRKARDAFQVSQADGVTRPA